MMREQGAGTRTRFAREGGYTGRRRNYKCRGCGQGFQHDGNQLPEKARLCLDCRADAQRD